MSIIEEIKKSVFVGNEEKSAELTKKAVEEGQEAETILNEALVKALKDCGTAYEKGQMFIPELLMAAEAMKGCMAIITPKMTAGADVGAAGKAVLGTVQGDVHDIGVELVGVMLETAGFAIKFLGGNVPTEEFITAVKEEKPHILGLSTLLSNTMPILPAILKRLEEEGLRDSVRVMVGGAPIRQEFCEEIGADGYAYDAVGAVPVAEKLRASM